MCFFRGTVAQTSCLLISSTLLSLSTTLVQTSMSLQPLNGLAYDFAQILMFACRIIAINLTVVDFSSCAIVRLTFVVVKYLNTYSIIHYINCLSTPHQSNTGWTRAGQINTLFFVINVNNITCCVTLLITFFKYV